MKKAILLSLFGIMTFVSVQDLTAMVQTERPLTTIRTLRWNLPRGSELALRISRKGRVIYGPMIINVATGKPQALNVNQSLLIGDTVSIIGPELSGTYRPSGRTRNIDIDVNENTARFIPSR